MTVSVSGMFSGILYTSRASENFDETSIPELTTDSAQRNQLKEITGYLSWKNRRFLQYIEGPPVAIEQLFQTICADDRHTVVSSIEFLPLEQRIFPRWSMRYIDVLEEQFISLEDILIDLSESLPSPPYELKRTREIAFNIISKLSKHLQGR